jgi:hypothetical protein
VAGAPVNPGARSRGGSSTAPSLSSEDNPILPASPRVSQAMSAVARMGRAVVGRVTGTAGRPVSTPPRGSTPVVLSPPVSDQEEVPSQTEDARGDLRGGLEDALESISLRVDRRRRAEVVLKEDVRTLSRRVVDCISMMTGTTGRVGAVEGVAVATLERVDRLEEQISSVLEAVEDLSAFALRLEARMEELASEGLRPPEDVVPSRAEYAVPPPTPHSPPPAGGVVGGPSTAWSTFDFQGYNLWESIEADLFSKEFILEFRRWPEGVRTHSEWSTFSATLQRYVPASAFSRGDGGDLDALRELLIGRYRPSETTATADHLHRWLGQIADFGLRLAKVIYRDEPGLVKMLEQRQEPHYVRVAREQAGYSKGRTLAEATDKVDAREAKERAARLKESQQRAEREKASAPTRAATPTAKPAPRATTKPTTKPSPKAGAPTPPTSRATGPGNVQRRDG